MKCVGAITKAGVARLKKDIKVMRSDLAHSNKSYWYLYGIRNALEKLGLRDLFDKIDEL